MFEVVVTTGSNGETMTFKGETLQDIITQVASAGASLEEDDYEDDLEDTDGCECCGNFVDLMDTLYSKLHIAVDLGNLQAVDVYSKAIQRLLAVA